MARHHKDYVNIYGGGARGSVVRKARSQAQWIQKDKAKSEDFVPCPECGRYYKNPQNNHYSDFKNRIRCRYSEEAHGQVFPNARSNDA